ncbi:winged helix-turn-helix domain-containing protein [Microbacterium sp. Se63.02b]|uniref:winged helix-turn-helix domain-containing protein n=1 Tax=Microbacterium sp. Se63.02b TaxID=2709304 RepID=UPI0016053BA5|nr:winged helix-turn-helix domain-containing protein [Microbacterium sp. Se63.02b]QNA91510.1 winged helix-turn-helix domain-containing protein [Microbacterium sp. Se63.02b]
MAPATQTVHSEGEIFRLVRTGAAQSRADLARLTGLSPSTVALRVEELIAHGYIEENGEGSRVVVVGPVCSR